MNKTKLIILIIYTIITILSCLNPIYPHEMFLQHSITIILFPFLLYEVFKNNFQTKTYLCILIFMSIHSIGARWIYSYVPYQEWFSFLGNTLQSTRNHFDRFVHFSYGFLFYPLIHELLTKKKHNPLIITTILWIIATSVIYEWFEMILAHILSQKDAENYNGQQGDLWDSHKDIALAMIGSIIYSIFAKSSTWNIIKKI